MVRLREKAQDRLDDGLLRALFDDDRDVVVISVFGAPPAHPGGPVRGGEEPGVGCGPGFEGGDGCRAGAELGHC